MNNENNNYALFENLNAGANDDEINPAWFPKYNQFENKPKEAIKHLLKVKKGDCLKALYREDIGHIDIVWGKNDENNNSNKNKNNNDSGSNKNINKNNNNNKSK